MTEKIPNDARWVGDIFDRRQYAIFLTKVLSENPKSFVLNIDSEWGTGKTFFIEKWEQEIKKNHPTVFFNAWKNDYSSDALLSIVSILKTEIEKYLQSNSDVQLNKFIKKSEKILKFLRSVAPSVIKGIAKHYIGNESVELLSEINEEDESSIIDITDSSISRLIEAQQETSINIKEFKIELCRLITKISEKNQLELPLFFFIDELDRCRPLFAIEVLEKAKHFFDIPEIKFVIATDTKQLSHSIKAVYGYGFDGRQYLRRFFDQEYSLPKPNHIEYSKLLFRSFHYSERIYLPPITINAQKDNHDNSQKILLNIDTKNKNEYQVTLHATLVFALFSLFFNLDLRTQKQCYNRVCSILTTFPEEGEKAHIILLIVLTMFKAKAPLQYEKMLLNSYAIAEKEMPSDFNKNTFAIRMSGQNHTAWEIMHCYFNFINLPPERVDELAKRQNSGVDLTNHIALNLYSSTKRNLSHYPELVDLAGNLR